MNLRSKPARFLCAVALCLVGCGSSGKNGNDQRASSAPGAAGHEGNAPDVPFEHPEVPTEYVPKPGKCGFDAPAFCDDFES